MKGLFLCALAVCMAVCARAQSVTQLPLQAGDTVVNTATISRFFPTLTGGYAAFQVQTELASNSGTIGGTMSLWASTDGITFQQVDSNRVLLPWRAAPQFNIETPPQPYYQLKIVGSGTQSTTWTIYYRAMVYQTNLP